MTKKLKIAVLCGGPSLERGISLNSARSVCDHLQGDDIEILPIYFDHFKNAYEISRAQLYCNTPSDFDFKLHSSARPLSKIALKNFLKKIDLAFPAMHGAFGEDGGVQRLLEKYKVPFVGSDSQACKKCFNKHSSNEFIASHGFYTLPSISLKSHLKNHKNLLTKFFKENNIKRAIVKPVTGGSSIAVFSVNSIDEALDKTKFIFNKKIDTEVVVESFCSGKEFTVIILENKFGLPTAILPTEIETDYHENQIFDYRKKYLATNQVRYHCPPRFENDIVEKIQIQAEQLFKLFGLHDFARFDGWLMEDGNIWFSDFNTVSGMEQNSFLFQQSSQIGMSHSDLLRYVVSNALRRSGQWSVVSGQSSVSTKYQVPSTKKPVNVLFGGYTAERQVSLMSGTNVWLKLRKSKKYEPYPFLLDKEGYVWSLPYRFTLNHTVEEILEACKVAEKSEDRLKILKKRVLEKLAVSKEQISLENNLPEKMTLNEFIKKSKIIFIGLHGGIGENGELQKLLDKNNVKYNGSDSKASMLCMDKFKTGEALKDLEKDGIYSAEKMIVKLKDLNVFKTKDFESLWKKIHKNLNSKTIIIKPRGDGCSAGIARLFNAKDLEKYIVSAIRGDHFIKNSTLTNQHGIIEMPLEKMQEIMLEDFIETDKPRAIKDKLKWQRKTGLIEITMGVVGKEGHMKAMNPSLTVAEGNILSLEEKFQGGTGINITPPPQKFVKQSAIDAAKKRMELVAKRLGLRGYCRIDAFMDIKTGELTIIEVNSLPGLTPSTVIYHQALAENPPMYPTEFLEKIVEIIL